MEFVTTLKGLLVIVIAIVPGYIFTRTRRRFAIVEEAKDLNHALIGYFVHSLVMLAIGWAVLARVGQDPSAVLKTRSANELALLLIGSPYTWGMTIVVIPAVLGFWSAVTTRYNLIALPFRLAGAVLRWLTEGKWTLQRMTPLPTLVQAWDAVWLQLNSGQTRTVIVGLEDGTTIAGVYDARSATSRSDRYPDIFLSQVCVYDDQGRIIPMATSDGVFIRGSRIVWMQLWQRPEVLDETDATAGSNPQGGAGHA